MTANPDRTAVAVAPPPSPPPSPASTRASRSDPVLSFEFFPPKTEKMEQALWSAVRRLAALGPRFVSVTYGAGGSTRERTHALVERIQREAGLVAAAHLTCVDATREEIDAIARAYWAAGIRHIVALRGDPPGGDGVYHPTPGGYAFAGDLVEGLLRVAPFELSVAAYPETHPQAPSPEADLDSLKRKIDAGAVRAITQFFFDNEDFYRFLDRAHGAGITVPIVPGILPIANFAGMTSFAARCGARVPGWLAERFAGLEGDPAAAQAVAVEVAAAQCRALHDHGVQQFHFYTMNRAELPIAVCAALGVRAEAALPTA